MDREKALREVRNLKEALYGCYNSEDVPGPIRGICAHLLGVFEGVHTHPEHFDSLVKILNIHATKCLEDTINDQQIGGVQ